MINEQSALVQKVSQGDELAFGKLVQPVFDRLYGFAFSVTKSKELAEEVVQDVFLQVWRHRQELPAIGNLTAWVYTIARNRTYNALRQQLKDPVLVPHLDDYWALSPASADGRLLFDESMDLIRQAVRQIPPQQAQVFTLSRLEGLSLDEIADRLELSKETVKKHLTKALKQVRASLEGASGGLLLVYGLVSFGLLDFPVC